jgi:hypothetical protein
MKGEVVVHIDTHDFFKRPEHEREALKEFLAAHGVPPNRFIIGDNRIYVRIGPDGGLWLDTWRAVEDADGKKVPCENCPACVRQERVEVALAAAVPLVADAYYAREVVVPDATASDRGASDEPS